MDLAAVVVIASSTWAVATGAAVAWVLLHLRAANKDMLAALETSIAALSQAEQNRPVGGLPPDLWKMEHDLKTRETSLREKMYEIQMPIKEAEAKLRTRAIHEKMARNTRTVRHPEA
tara:strand:+ start:364 stop:714 length:351 start_codon:yes stop_codon:yes gene_type:complete